MQGRGHLPHENLRSISFPATDTQGALIAPVIAAFGLVTMMAGLAGYLIPAVRDA